MLYIIGLSIIQTVQIGKIVEQYNPCVCYWVVIGLQSAECSWQQIVSQK